MPFFFKQWGEFAPTRPGDDTDHVFPDFEKVTRYGKRAAGRLLDGREHNELPWGLAK